MATIRNRRGGWQVQIRRKGHPSKSKTFPTKAAAQAWAKATENALSAKSVPITNRPAPTLAECLCRYEREVTATKRSADRELYKIGALRSHRVARLPMCSVTSEVLAGYRDERLRLVAPATVRRELAILSHCFSIARREWGLEWLKNPVRLIRLPKASVARERRLDTDERVRLEQAVRSCRQWYLAPIVRLALETGMRRGELLALRWPDLRIDRRTVKVRLSKNGQARDVPLTTSAIAEFSALPKHAERIFPVKAPTFRAAWDRAVRLAGITDLRFHDLRHEAISRFFELGLSVPEVALISGHKDIRMLFRYTHLRAETVAGKLP